MILAVGLGTLRDDLAESSSAPLQVFETPEQVMRTLKADPSDVVVVLLGPQVESPLIALRRIKSVCPEVLVLLVAAPADVPALQHALLLMPQVGEPARVLEESPALPRHVREHTAWARERSRHRMALRRVNAQLDAQDPPEREPPSLIDGLLEHAPIAVFLLDHAGNVVHENGQARSLLPPRPRSTRLIDRVPSSVRAAFESLLGDDGAPRTAQVDLPGGEGEVRHHEARVTHVQLTRRRRGRLLLLHDVTEIMVAQRELEVAQAELARAEKLATIGSLVGGLAHEIRTPLTLVQNHLHLLESRISRAASLDEVREQAPALLAGAVDGSERIHSLVQDLRRLLRGETPRMREVSLSEPVLAAVRIFTATRSAGPHVETALGAGRLLQLDPSQVQQVVINLLENAVAASPGDGHIRIVTRDVESGSELVVEDWGIGIPPDIQERMFETFVTTKPEGNGFGLNIVRRIVELHKAVIRVESRLGEGTRFIITFPAAKKDASIEV